MLTQANSPDPSLRPMLLAGLGTATPQHAIGQREAAAMAAGFVESAEPRERTLAALYRTTRIRHRGSVLLEPPGTAGSRQSFFPPAAGVGDPGPGTRRRLARYEQEAPPLAAAAAGEALSAAGIGAEACGHLVTCSCTGFSNPGVDLRLIERLGLRRDITRTHVGFMGCHGGFNALRVAAALAGSATDAAVLLVAVELCSLHLQYGDRSDLVVANAIFADGAAAAVGVPPAGTMAGRGLWRLAHQASLVLPDSDDAMGWLIGDHGFEMTLSPRVPSIIAEHLPGFVDRELARLGLDSGDVGSWAVHPGGPRVLSTVGEAMGLAGDALVVSQEVLAAHGNMSSATIFFILERLMAADAPLPCVAVAFGPGLTCELAVFSG
jgi:predicted naringenin-chalcone synthase